MSGAALATAVALSGAVVGMGTLTAVARRAGARARLVRRLLPAGGPAGTPVRAPRALDSAVRPPAWLVAGMARAAVAASPERVWRCWLGATVGATLLAAVAIGPVAAAVTAAVVAGAPAVGLRALAGRDVAVLERALPDALDGLPRSLRAGGSVRTALAELAEVAPPPLAGDLDRLVRAVDQGIPMATALDRWAAERPCPGVRLTVAALVLGIESGAGLGRTLEGVATTLHERAALRREVHALATQARYSAGVLALAPPAFLLVAGAIDPSVLSFLFTTSSGLLCLVVGLVLDAAGGVWMLRITRSAA
jgi:tight adherence protein B